jgi:hypothetical protein
MRNRTLPALLPALVVVLSLGTHSPATADPLHSRPDGTYWHHDSGWLFPERIGEFVRVGAPQDVAGSPDAVAYYARLVNGARVLAAVDVFQAASAAEATTLETARVALVAGSGADAKLLSGNLDLQTRGYQATRVIAEPTDTAAPLRVLYFIDTGAWRVRIRVEMPRGASDTTTDLDAFVRDQRWETLP